MLRCFRSASRSKWTRSSPSEPDPLDPGPAGFAHRGLHGPGVPENSLAAFAAAIRMGAGIECDLRLTRDGRIVVFHDGDAVRLCGDPLVFAHATLSDVAQLRLGGAPIPTIEDLLDLIQGQVPLLLEVKSEDDSDRWPAALGRALADYRGGFGIMSFNPLIGRLLKAKLPDVRRGFVFDAKLSPFRRRLALSLTAPEFVAVSREIVADPSVQSLRRTVPVYSWTIRTAEERAQAKVQADALIWEADGRP